MRKLWIVVCVLSVGTARAQQKNPPPTRPSGYAIAKIDAATAPASLKLFDAMDAAISRLSTTAGLSDTAVALVANIRKKTNWLRGRWQNAPTDPLAFRQSFAYDVAVARAAADDRNADRALHVLSAINDDIVEKADHCAKSASGMATPVRVSIRTVADGKESSNWQVFYLPKIMEFAAAGSSAAMQFKVFSSPAIDDLAPGRYVVWAKRPGASGAESEHTTIRVGGGATELKQDIAVPK
ncbi:MAG TPA: hypothetical protein VGM82_03120 [Gemmatimonadaceae bacterium]|jgi:hypothetical protein